MFRQALEILEKVRPVVLGPEHPDIISIANCLGYPLADQGKHGGWQR